ncbi:tetratricopeptide repeat protein [Vannielia litorea]|uniref:tetratricopeptide repeat protein n=1 Tax=Vannielia litorea TaxID=1217970 RepID=UPI001C9773B4|nr:tetratricopeptide repeat protein [Vannielia litorea]MBY6047290.1 tetratricopeptide repeat protein [Vannielia litorea]MBY6074704.1 tetratricopeptide repeat protein [Vannielia litorea]
MQHDHYGNPLSTAVPEAVAQYDAGVHLFLSAGYGASACFEAAIEADPRFAAGHAALGRARMMEGRMGEARAALATARDLAAEATEREQAQAEILTLVAQGRAAEARAAVKAHVLAHPRDALAAQLCTNIFGLIGFSGEVGREAELLAFTEALLPQYPGDWWMMSMHALSLCETGQVAASHALMAEALALNPRNAHAAHFRAHAQYEDGETEAGRATLAEWLADYDDRGLLHGHLSWHLALWTLESGDAEALWPLLDNHVGPGGAKSLPINLLTDTAALLYRAEMAGFEVDPTRWQAISDYAAQHFPDPGQSFADMHAALAHAMAGQGERLAKLTEASKGFAGDLIGPIARTWGHVARQEWQAALDELTTVLPTAERIGGSRAQRDLLELTYANVLMKLGHTDEARRTLALRRPVLGLPA